MDTSSWHMCVEYNIEGGSMIRMINHQTITKKMYYKPPPFPWTHGVESRVLIAWPMMLGGAGPGIGKRNV